MGHELPPQYVLVPADDLERLLARTVRTAVLAAQKDIAAGSTHKWITTRQALAHLACGRKKLAQLVAAEHIRRNTSGRGKQIKYNREDIENYIENPDK